MANCSSDIFIGAAEMFIFNLQTIWFHCTCPWCDGCIILLLHIWVWHIWWTGE